MRLQRKTLRSSKNLNDDSRLYSHGALSVTMELIDTECPSTNYLVTVSKADLEGMLKLITDRENEIKELK